MRLPVRHCSGSVASIGKADAVWLTNDYRVCSDELMRAGARMEQKFPSGFDVKKRGGSHGSNDSLR
jgi:hypothetical protein